MERDQVKCKQMTDVIDDRYCCAFNYEVNPYI